MPNVMEMLSVNYNSNIYQFAAYACALLCVVLFLYTRRRKYQHYPRGPYSLPFLGSVGFFKQYKKKRQLHVEEVRKKYGDVFSVKAGTQLVVFLNGYDVIHEAFVNQSDVFSDRPNWLNSLQQGLAYGKGLVWQDADKSATLRKFALKSLRGFGVGKASLENRILEEVQALADVFREHAFRPFTPKQCLHKAVTNIIHQVVFGERLEYEDEQLDHLLFLISEFFIGGLLIPRNFLPKFICRLLPKDEVEYKRKRDTVEGLKDYIFNYIAEHERDFDSDNIRDFVDLYLDACEKGGEETCIITKGEIFRSILDLFLAGAETVATSLVWCLVYMVKYPAIQERCFEEIYQITGDNPSIGMSYKGKLPYTEATLLEVQRLATVAPVGVAHATSRDTRLMGYYIPKGTIVLSNLVSCAMDPEVWDKPEDFEPERFLDERGQLQRHKKLIPFSIGPRMCLGDNMAKMEMFLIFTNLIKRFRFLKSGNTDLDNIGMVGEGQVIFSADKFDIGVVERSW